MSSASISTICSTCRSRRRCARFTTPWTMRPATAGKRATVASLVRRLSERQPLLLVVEDVHWADRLTLEHLAGLTETVAACPALLIMTSRIEGDPLDRGLALEHRGQSLDDHRSRPAAASTRRPRSPGRISTRQPISPSAASSAPPATPCSSSSSYATPSRARRPACRARCRAWSRRAWTSCDPHDKQALQAASVVRPALRARSAAPPPRDPDYDCAALVATLPGPARGRRFPVRPRPDP